jgi:antitoxin CptB
MRIDDTRLRQVKYRAWRRGFREADLILGPFADSHAENLNPDQLEAFERLLDQPDPDLYAWIVEQAPTPPEFDGDVMRMLKQFRFEAFEARGPDHGG